MIPGFIIAILTFPGVIVHELAHQLFCRWLKIPVFKVCYFRVGNPSGYVIHEHPASAWKSLLVGVGPLFFNTALGAFIALPAVLGSKFQGGPDEGGSIAMMCLNGVLIWLGVSIAMHSFPSRGDAASIKNAVMRPGQPILAKIVGVPLVGLIWLGAIGSVFWLDLIWGALVACWLPGMILHAIAAI